MKASTVVGWHRKGFRLFWTWKISRGKPGRPVVPKEVRELIRTMSRDNPLWGVRALGLLDAEEQLQQVRGVYRSARIAGY